MKYKKGFTLIELLVVIAIIGILSAVVLAALQVARNKGNDSAVKGAVKQLATQIEQYGNSSNSYTGACTDSQVVKIINNIASNNGNGGASSYYCNAATNAWAFATMLSNGNDGDWCIDSTGKVGGTVGNSSNSYAGLTGASGALNGSGSTNCQ